MIILRKEAKEFEKLLLDNSMNQSDLARKLKVNRVAITNLKNSTKTSIGEIKVRKLCKILNISFKEWFMPQ